jgi:hypothetical protein
VDERKVLHSLSAVKALQILVKSVEEVSPEGLENIRVLIEYDPDRQTQASFSLIVPFYRRPRRPAERLAEALATAYTVASTQNPDLLTVPEQASLPLRDGVTWMLALRDTDDIQAAALADEYLLIADSYDPEMASQLLDQLVWHAIHTTWAVAANAAGPLYMFHTRDNLELAGSLASVIASGTLPPPLAAFRSDDWIVFAEPLAPPGAAALHQFCRLAALAPQLFSDTPASGRSNLKSRRPLAALRARPTGAGPHRNGGDPQPLSLLQRVLRRPGAPTAPTDESLELELFYLHDLTFQSQVTLEPQRRRYAKVLFHNLTKSDEAQKNLRAAIDATQQPIGYHLRLEPARDVVDSQQERVRLLEQLAEIEHDLEYLDSLGLVRPRLLRFTNEQLPALADFVRSFSIMQLKRGALLYAAKPIDADGGALHFLLTDPHQVPQEKLDPLPRWDINEHVPIRYWLDPFWARSYLGAGDSLIFVPEGTALAPTMHPDTAKEMDSYMKEVVAQWFSGSGGMPAIPARPLYVFEPHESADGHITLAVLDREAFLPLGEKLDWLNDHIHLRIGRQQSHALLQKITTAMREEQIQAMVEIHSAHTLQAIQQSAQATSDHVATLTRDLTEQLSREIESLLEESTKTRTALIEARDRLNQFTVTRREMEGLIAGSEQAVKETGDLVTTTGAAITNLRSKMDSETIKAEEVHKHIQSGVERLRDRFNRLKQWLDTL